MSDIAEIVFPICVFGFLALLVWVMHKRDMKAMDIERDKYRMYIEKFGKEPADDLQE